MSSRLVAVAARSAPCLEASGVGAFGNSGANGLRDIESARGHNPEQYLRLASSHALGAALVEEAVYKFVFRWVIISSSRAAQTKIE
jgi:hypothetical protein